MAAAAAKGDTGMSRGMPPADRQELFERLRELNPAPTTELEYSSRVQRLTLASVAWAERTTATSKV
jgi:hypothetical protein